MRQVIMIVGGLLLAGCAATGGGGSVKSDSEEGFVHAPADAAHAAMLASDEPLTTPSAVLFVNGLGCPQCATNIDLQLLRLRGVDEAKVDLSNGTVVLGLKASGTRPSPRRLVRAVEDAGFTLVKIETR
jgi:copper chaperone CopZ